MNRVVAELALTHPGHGSSSNRARVPVSVFAEQQQRNKPGEAADVAPRPGAQAGGASDADVPKAAALDPSNSVHLQKMVRIRHNPGSKQAWTFEHIPLETKRTTS